MIRSKHKFQDAFLRVLVLTVLFWASLTPASGQLIIINSNGEHIIMYPDGSWRLADAGDSLLLRQNLQKSETVDFPSDKIDPAENRILGEDEEYTLRQWNELYSNIKNSEKKAQNNFREATNAQFKAGELLQNAEANKSMIDSDRLGTLHDEYDRSIYNLRIAKMNQQAILKIADDAKKLTGQPPDKIKKKLPQLNSKYENYLATYDQSRTMEDLSKSGLSPAENNYPGSASNPSTSQSSTKQNHYELAAVTVTHEQTAKPASLRLPPQQILNTYKSEPYQCEITTDTVDTATGRRRIVLARGLIFTDTDPDLRPYFKNKELITCYGRLLKIDAYIYFFMDFEIASSHSQRNFGSLEKGSLLQIRLLNGKYVSLYNLKTDQGRIDPYSGHTIFTGQYALGKSEIKMLSSGPLDKMRLLWSTGYDDYDVYKIDFFTNQINCLMSK